MKAKKDIRKAASKRSAKRKAKPAPGTKMVAKAKPSTKPAKPAHAAKQRPSAPLKAAQTPKEPSPYDKVFARVLDIIGANASCEAKMLEICWLLNSKFPHFNWVGFYIATPDKALALGPYVGESTEHTRIPFGSGICGQAAEREETFVVQDVSQQTNYLACSPMVKSEIVVPIMRDGKVMGELDIDSHKVAPFTPDDRKFLERVCKALAPLL